MSNDRLATIKGTKARNLLNLSMALSLGLGLVFLLLTGTRALAQEEHTQDRSSPHSREGILQRAPAAVTLTRGPYPQSVTTASVIVVWETAGPAGSQVDYGPTAGYGFAVSDPSSVTYHALTLTGLNPYSVYHYQISSDGQLLGGDNAFRSAAPLTQTTFTFAVYGDTQANDTPHQSVVNRIIALAPNFLLHTGDHVGDGNSSSQWANFFAIEQNLLRQTPLFSSPGNHAYNSALYFAAFHQPGNERWYSFDYGDAHFVSLQIDGNVAYTPGSEQYVWLQNDLANTDRLWKVVFFHIPPYSSGAHGGDSSVRDALTPLFDQYNVDIVFSGHDHDYERSVVSDVVYIVNGGGGGTLRDPAHYNPYSVYFAKTNHCVSITIDGNTLTGVGVQPDGTQFDPFTIIKPFVHAGFNSSSPDWLGQVTVFTNTTASSGTPTYLWAFGDGATSMLVNLTHTYTFPGIYTVALTATIPTQSDVAIATATIYSPPAASFTARPTSGLRPLTVAFTATVTTMPPGDPTLAYVWRFGDGASSSLPTPTHTYTSADIYTVTLIASNTTGQSAVTRTNYITAYDPVTADFTAAPRMGAAPLMVVFTNTSTGDYITSLWAFGNGITSTATNPVHTYKVGGLYTVTLTISGLGGKDTLPRTDYITAYNSVTADFTATPRTGAAPLMVVFTNTSTGTYTANLWNFGDGTMSTMNDPLHTYMAGSLYTVTLIVSGPAGSSVMTKPAYITVWEKVYLPLVLRLY